MLSYSIEKEWIYKYEETVIFHLYDIFIHIYFDTSRKCVHLIMDEIEVQFKIWSSLLQMLKWLIKIFIYASNCYSKFDVDSPFCYQIVMTWKNKEIVSFFLYPSFRSYITETWVARLTLCKFGCWCNENFNVCSFLFDTSGWFSIITVWRFTYCLSETLCK